METTQVSVVRIYLRESEHKHAALLRRLQEWEKVRGVTVFRAVSGFGEHGAGDAKLLDLALDLPLVIEFFDTPEKVEKILQHIAAEVRPWHLIRWQAEVLASNEPEQGSE